MSEDQHTVEVVLRNGEVTHILALADETLLVAHEILPKTAQGITTWASTGDIVVSGLNDVELARFPADFVAAVIRHNDPKRLDTRDK